MKLTGVEPPPAVDLGGVEDMPVDTIGVQNFTGIPVSCDPTSPNPPDVSALPMWARKVVTADYWRKRSRLVPIRKTLFGNDCPPGEGWVYVVQYFTKLFGQDGREDDWRNDTTISPYGFRTLEAATRECQRRQFRECEAEAAKFRVHQKWVGTPLPVGQAWFSND